MLHWKTYVEAILGYGIEDAQEKFDALDERERSAWEAVAQVVPQ